MHLPKSFTTVTTLSKTLAFILFITLPVVGFYLGTLQSKESSISAPKSSTSEKEESKTKDWQTYKSKQLGISFRYPPSWNIEINADVLATSSAVAYEAYSPINAEMLRTVPQAEREKFVITIQKWPEKAQDLFVLLGQWQDSDIAYEASHFNANDFIYSKPSKSSEDYKLIYREQGLMDKKSSAFNNDVRERDAFFILDNGDVIYIKGGIFAGVEKDFYDQFLPTFNNYSPPPTSSLSETPDKEAKTYTDQKLGITFKYLTKNPSVTVFTVGENKICITYDESDSECTNGQYVEVFNKQSSQTLKEAIGERFLSGYDKKECFVQNLPVNEDKIDLRTAEITYPEPSDPQAYFFANSEKCPGRYSKTNGLRFFMMDTTVPDKFAFFNIGQYVISGSNEQTSWHETFEFLK